MQLRKQRAKFENWFATWRGKRTPQEEAALLAVADAYDVAVATKKLSRKGLQLIVDAASSKRTLLWVNTVDLLQSLEVRFESASEAIREMFESSQSHVRFAALCCVTKKTPPANTHEILKAGLKDKSSRVRWKAAQRIFHLNVKKLLPELEHAFNQETNAKARNEINLHLRLLRDGYILEHSTDSGYYVTVRIKDGTRTGYITEQAMRKKGIAKVTAELRDR